MKRERNKIMNFVRRGSDASVPKRTCAFAHSISVQAAHNKLVPRWSHEINLKEEF